MITNNINPTIAKAKTMMTAATIPPMSPPVLLGESDDVGISLTGDTINLL